MSDNVILPVSLNEVGSLRSSFKPLKALHVRRSELSASVDEYARGLADGEQIAATAFALERDRLLALLANAEALKPEAGPELSILLRETVFRLVKQICERVVIDAELLDAQIAEAVAIISEADGARQVFLHPDDAVLVGDSVFSLPVRSDPRLDRGMIRIKCSQGWIEHGMALGVERLQQLLEIPE